MLGNILGRKKGDTQEDSADKELAQKISKMNLTEMRSYIKNKIKDFEVSEDGLCEVMRCLTSKNEKGEYYLKADDMDSKKKKAFELILTIVQNKKINIVVVELIQKFMEIYDDIIKAYDREHKEIYESRLVDAIKLALLNISKKAALKNKMNILGEDEQSI
jgi:Ni,Fe-hydrogenase III component G